MSGVAALCAILLLSFAPLASQLFAHSRLDAMLASFCASKGRVHASTQPLHDAHLHLQACAYCDLVSHAPTPPVIANAGSRFVPLRAPFSVAIAGVEPHATPLRDALPRAPPAFA